VLKELLDFVNKAISYIFGSKKNNHPSRYYDLTRPIASDVAVFPGDPDFKIEKVREIAKGSSYNLCCLHMGNHTGTHIDFPAHVIKNGKTSSDYDADAFIGEGVIIDVPEDNKNLGITSEFIKKQQFQKNDLVFFKTSNSKLASNKISEKFVYLTPQGADELIQKQVKMVGIDYLSIDALEDESLPSHNKLLKNDILIVENLQLSDIPAGRYKKFIVSPPRINDMDGLPVRVFVYN
jgi:arylformamidase